MKSSLAPVLLSATSLLLVSLAGNVAAQVAPVVDLTSSTPKPVVRAAAAVDDRYNQSQMMQNEVRELRGLVEQLSYELQRVKQRQMDDYLDLDRRLSAVLSGATPEEFTADADGDLQLNIDDQSAAVVAGSSVINSDGMEGQVPNQALEGQAVDGLALNGRSLNGGSLNGVSQTPTITPAINTEEIAQNYAQASNLLLKERDINAAAQAFKQHVIDYPASPYTANAHYWLGEIYLLQGQDEMARQAFTLVVEQHPKHSKAMDATFKLGKIYHQLGEIDRARELLEKASRGTGGAASKAQRYLKTNF
ncbi:MAG: tol-pal system protein YbgF [Porticoccaceae bacterium]|nr:tol-pal system protein YbgF [Porticoccaceae bacterium]